MIRVMIAAPPRIADAATARALFASIAGQPFETCGFAYLGRDNALLGMRHARSASPYRIEVPIRTLAWDALAFDARRIVMAHNHPGGDPAPSPDDIAVTRRIARALDALGIRLVEHVVLAGDRFTSMRDAGIL